MDLADLTLKEFNEKLGSGEAAPGGGSASALAGAFGAALCAMVARFTVGREKYKDAWEEMEKAVDEADALSARLLELVDEDTRAYAGVLEAFKLPKSNEAEKAARAAAVEEAMKGAAMTPFETLEAVCSMADLVRLTLERGNTNCLSDAAVAGQLMRAAAHGAAYNVRINLSSVKDEDFKSRYLKKTEELLARAVKAAREFDEHTIRGLK